MTWSPDGKHLTYLDGGELMDVDPVTGKTHVMVSAAKMDSLDGRGGSERDRDHRERYNMAGYLWAPDSTHLLFDADGRLWLYDLRNGTGVQIGFTGAASGDDPKFSPDGSCVSFIRDHGLSVVHLRDPGTPAIAVAPAPSAATASKASADRSILNGEVDWVYEEELDTRSNYFWSPDSKNLAYLQMNETAVPQYPLTDWIPTHAQVEWQRYPQPGDANPLVQVGVVSAKGGKTTWMNIPIQAGDYIPRFGWVNRNTVWVETVSRDHKHRTLFFVGSELWRRAQDAGDQRRQVPRRRLRRGRGRWRRGSDQLERRTYASLSLQLRHGHPAGQRTPSWRSNSLRAISKWAMCIASTPSARSSTTHRMKAIHWSSRSGRSTSTASAGS